MHSKIFHSWICRPFPRGPRQKNLSPRYSRNIQTHTRGKPADSAGFPPSPSPCIPLICNTTYDVWREGLWSCKSGHCWLVSGRTYDSDTIQVDHVWTLRMNIRLTLFHHQTCNSANVSNIFLTFRSNCRHDKILLPVAYQGTKYSYWLGWWLF